MANPLPEGKPDEWTMAALALSLTPVPEGVTLDPEKFAGFRNHTFQYRPKEIAVKLEWMPDAETVKVMATSNAIVAHALACQRKYGWSWEQTLTVALCSLAEANAAVQKQLVEWVGGQRPRINFEPGVCREQAQAT